MGLQVEERAYAEVDEWLTDYMAAGPALASVVFRDAASRGFTRLRLYNAKAKLGVRSHKLDANEAKARGVPVGSFLWVMGRPGSGRGARYSVIAERAQWGAGWKVLQKAFELDGEFGVLQLAPDLIADARKLVALIARADILYAGRHLPRFDDTRADMLESAERGMGT